MTISSSWTEPVGFSIDEAFAAASGCVAPEAGGASREADGSMVEFAGGGAAELLDDPGMAGVLTTPASSGQREPTTDGFAPASPALARCSITGLIAAVTAAAARFPVKTLVSGSTRDCGNGNSARALAIEGCVVALFGGEAALAAGGASGAARETFVLASPMYQQALLVARSMR